MVGTVVYVRPAGVVQIMVPGLAAWLPILVPVCTDDGAGTGA